MYQGIYITLHLYSNNMFKMVNLPLLLWHNIQAHIYPLVLPKMAPFCMKIAKIVLGEDPRTPFNQNHFTCYYTMYTCTY